MDDVKSRPVADLDDRLARIGIEGYWKLVGVSLPEPTPRGEPPGGDGVLFSATDEPVFKAFALDRVEQRG
jgi:hypothetical protein